MRLQTKINYRFLSLLLIVFLVAGGILYVVMGMVVNQNLDENLQHRSKRVIQSLSINSSITAIAATNDPTIKIRPVNRSKIPEVFTDTLISEDSHKEKGSYRKMTFGAESNGQHFEVTLLLSRFETEDFVELIFYSMLCLFALIVFILFFLNRWLSSSVWYPFYKTLDQLNTFKIDSKSDLNFENSDVFEFRQLNKSLNILVQKMQSDFRNLKEFTENASHEIQTPVAIIKSKLENVLQDKTLATKQYEQIQQAYESVTRLSKLNEALLLLSKIENQQFPDVAEIDLYELVSQQSEFIEELIAFKKIQIILTDQNPLVVKMNPYLADILINNLLGNAVKHNVENGQIIITSSENELTISNTGKPLTISPDQLFQRFYKQNTGNESTGLGLAIASEICSKSGLILRYDYQNGFHNLTLSIQN
jgi:signal transduction histidine kinase